MGLLDASFDRSLEEFDRSTELRGLRSCWGFSRPRIPRWRGGRVAEGAPLLRAYTLTRIEGSNPFLSATVIDPEKYNIKTIT